MLFTDENGIRTKIELVLLICFEESDALCLYFRNKS